MAWEFFEYYLLDLPNNWQNTDMITYYETGKDIWNSSNATTIEETSSEILYLRDGNQLSSNPGWSQSNFVSDPSNPAPTIGGANLHVSLNQGPYNQISLESRNDIITFETNSLTDMVTISGRVEAHLEVEADQPDCDVVVHLVDVYPDGRNMLITDGIRRMRFRNGYYQADETFMSPGVVYPVTVELPFTNYTWLPGHKIKVYIGANSSLRWNVNLQDGGTMYQTGPGNIANISIHHNTSNASYIELPGSHPTLAINELGTETIRVSPNPATETISIDNSVQSFTIVDLTGKIVLQGTDTQLISIKNLEKGSYIIQCMTQHGAATEQFVKL
jgi:putative CocE/NonD family hydrolase